MSKFIKGIIIVLGVLGSSAIMTQLAFQSNRGYAEEFTIPAPATVNLNTASLNMPGTLTVSGTLQASSGTVTISNSGNWSNSGVFTAGNSDVVFAGTNHAINGTSTFYNLTCNVPNGRLTFEASSTQTITNTTSLKGTAGNQLTLVSSPAGTQWLIDPQGTRDIDFVTVQDSKNINATAITPTGTWTNNGNNTNWNAATPTPTPTPGGGGGGGGGVVVVTLTVSSASPSSGATGVAVNTAISATFSDNMNGSTLTTDTFKVSGNGSTVSGLVTTSSNKATFTASSNLSYNTTYTVTITTGAQAANAAGTSLSSDYSWSFTTVSGGVSTPTPTPISTPTAAVTPIQTVTPTSAPTLTPSPTPTPTPAPTEGLYLSKYIAYLSGDTIVATVIDADRNTGSNSADTLTTAIKATGLNYSIGTDLLLDLKEDGVNSGTFLATIKTGTTTIGGASSSTRANSGTIKAIQGGMATVTYTDTTPNASTITKTLSFSSFDATLVFDADTYTLGSYAGITLADAERNTNHTEAETLSNDVFIETSSLNITRLRMIEMGVDTGTFRGSIQVAASGGTLEFERIQTTAGDTLKITYIDEINTTGSARVVTDTASVVDTVVPTPTLTPSPTPTPTPTPTLTPSPTSVVCEVVKMELSPKALMLKIKKRKSGYVSVILTGENNCPVEGEVVSALVSKANKKLIEISSTEEVTNSQGEVTFKITALKKTGVARVNFEAGNLRKTLRVKVKR